MPQPAGDYPDGQGNIRYWNGQYWTDKVRTPAGGYAHDPNVPSGSPPGEFWREGPPRAVPTAPDDPAVNPFPIVPAGLPGCIVGGFALVLLPRVLWWAYKQQIQAHRWELLVLLVVVTAVWAVRRITGKPRLVNRAVGAIIWFVLLISTVGGFRGDNGSDSEPKPAPSYDVVAEARKVLVAAGRGDEDLCSEMPGELQGALQERTGYASCFGAFQEIARQTDAQELEQLKNVQVTVLGKRDVKPCCAVFAEPRTYYRVRLGANPLGWKEMEFSPGKEVAAIMSVTW
ncbi:hypothetical protein Acsp04_49400 [Actinomadura sp. NBRC 104425]|uniref:DUF2510 domain-containing protein n=1 Tax=Actinomadura sp. NBRC 104425 TaxID=3032204 RepID=UPI0024A3E74B|nr:DUF2510 domain-containing protein [Actinomadura sp. NBRC 104425]GLZ14705.1 hypothetical protein Acsp04_49400 [Actinomadura sp. NBRC 104425]